MINKERVSVLRLTLHGVTVGFLAGYLGGKNVLAFDPAFRERRSRPTLSLVTHPDFPKAAQLLAKPWVTQQRLHPVLSNMLPESAQREHLAQALKVHIDHELPSRLRSAGRVARHTCGTGGHSRLPLQHRTGIEPVPVPPAVSGLRFSLAGVRNKFSMRQRERRYDIAPPGSSATGSSTPPHRATRSCP